MNKKRTFVLSSLVIMMFVTYSGIFLNGIQQRNTSLHGIQKIYPKSSAPHSKIYIDGNNALNAYCAGNGTDGTYSDPHIFKNYEVDAGKSGSGIEIRNTDLYLIIQNCSIINSGGFPYGGIKLYNCKNINITDCHINDNFYGVYLENSENNMLSRNNVSHNTEHGIYLFNSNDNTLSYNKAFDNSDYGIFLTDSDSNTINQNDAIHNNYYSIFLASSDSNILTENNASLSISDSGFLLINSNYNTLSNNFATRNNRQGIYLLNSNNSKLTKNTVSFNSEQGIQLMSSNNNLLTENVAYNNTQNGLNMYYSDNTTLLGNDLHNNFQNGIYFFFSDNWTILDNNIKENQQDGLNLYQSDNNIFSGNIISDNVNRGIFLDDANSGSDHNTFYINFFVNNGIHAIDETSNNDWNNTVIGNYWDNYTGVDDDNDGIGDSPHIFNGGTDFLPIVDDQAPIITIQSPIGNELFRINAPDYVIEIIELYLDTMWYTIDGGITNITFTENGTISQSAWDALPDGDVVIRFYASDFAGNSGSQEVTIRKDADAPIITINNPQNNVVFGAIAPNFNISIDEPNLDKVWYSLNGGTNITFTELTGTINQALWDALPEGNVVIKFYANDTLGRIGFQEVTIKKDVTAPIITINNPQNNDLIGATAPDFNISIDEPNLDKVWYSLNSGTNITFTGLTGTIDQVLWVTLWDDLSDGDLINIRFYANDTFGHLTYKEIVVIKSDPPQPTPGGIPGYDLFLFISVLFISVGIISIIAIKKRVNI